MYTLYQDNPAMPKCGGGAVWGSRRRRSGSRYGGGAGGGGDLNVEVDSMFRGVHSCCPRAKGLLTGTVAGIFWETGSEKERLPRRGVLTCSCFSHQQTAAAFSSGTTILPPSTTLSSMPTTVRAEYMPHIQGEYAFAQVMANRACLYGDGGVPSLLKKKRPRLL